MKKKTMHAEPSYTGVCIDELPGSWPALFEPLYRRAHHLIVPGDPLQELNTVLAAVKYLIDACPEDDVVQIAARHGGIVGKPGDAKEAISAMRAAAVIELIQEAQKERQSVSAYRRVLTALRVLGINPDTHGQGVLKQLEYHDYNGEPYVWLAKKLKEKGK